MSTDRESPRDPADPADPAEPAVPAGAEPASVPLPAPTAPHDVDGTELALSIARAIARSPGARSRRGGWSEGSGRGGSGGGELRGFRRRGRAAASGAHPDDRDPQTTAASLGRLIAEQGWGTDLRVHGVMARWASVVGQDIAAHTTPESYDDGRLTVRADSTAWATQLTLLASSLVARLNHELGDGTVTFIEVQGPRGPSWRRGARRVQGRGPRDTYG